MLYSYSSIIQWAYNPEVVPSDFHLFGPLKLCLESYRFHRNEGVEMTVR
jgi:hypothetical protein